MEQKRVLWIVAAVGLFLLVVIGTALWISAPSRKGQSSLNMLQGYGSSWVHPSGIISSAPAGDAGKSDTVVDLNTLNKTGYVPSAVNAVNNEGQGNAPAVTAQPEQGNVPASSDPYAASAGIAQTSVTLNVNITPSSSSSTATVSSQQGTAGKSETQNQVSQAQPASAQTQKTADGAAKTSSAAGQTKTSSTSETTKTTTSAASTQTTKSTGTSQTVQITASVAATAQSASKNSGTKTVPATEPDNFWVQIASFTGKTNAEDARSALADQKISGEVFTYQDAKGTIYYRLRVGPYKTKSEAEYWNKIIKEIDGISGNDTYVVNSTVH